MDKVYFIPKFARHTFSSKYKRERSGGRQPHAIFLRGLDNSGRVINFVRMNIYKPMWIEAFNRCSDTAVNILVFHNHTPEDALPNC